MFTKLGLLAFVAPLVQCLTLNAPSKPAPISGGPTTFTWTVAQGDPSSFSLYLNHPSFNSVLGIANNVPTNAGTLTLTLPLIPADSGYTAEAVAISDVNQVFSTSPAFTVGPEASTSTTSTSTTSASKTSTSSTVFTTVTTPLTTSSTSGFGVTQTNTQTTSNSAPSNTTTTTNTGPLNAAVSVRASFSAGGVAVLLLSVLAGATVVAL